MRTGAILYKPRWNCLKKKSILWHASFKPHSWHYFHRFPCLKVAVSRDLLAIFILYESNLPGPLINRLKWFCWKFVSHWGVWLCTVLFNAELNSPGPLIKWFCWKIRFREDIRDISDSALTNTERSRTPHWLTLRESDSVLITTARSRFMKKKPQQFSWHCHFKKYLLYTLFVQQTVYSGQATTWATSLAAASGARWAWSMTCSATGWPTLPAAPATLSTWWRIT